MAKKSVEKRREKATSSKLVLAVGLFAMLLLIWGTVSQGGSLQQKTLFAIGAPLLGVVAYVNRQTMFAVLQAIATLGAWVAFFPILPDVAKYAIMAGSGMACIGFLFKDGYFEIDRYGIIGAAGLFLIALGFATDPSQFALWFDIFLGFGGLAVALYSAIGFVQGVRIALIWLVLNIIFSISPLLDLLKQLKVI